MDVLVVGNAICDSVWLMPNGLGLGDKGYASEIAEYSGGQGANTAWTLGVLGLAVQFVGVFGDDNAGQRGRSALEAVGVSLEGSRTVPACRSQQATIVVDAASGERTIVMYRDPRLVLGSVDPSWVELAGVVYTDGHELEASLAAGRAAAASATPFVADAEEVGTGWRKLLPLVSCLVAPLRSVEELTSSSGADALSALVDQGGPATVVATDGGRGCLGRNRAGALVRVPGQRCAIRDTTGAGDAFHAGYIAGVVAGMEFEEALLFAAELAAATCEVPGPRISPDRVASFAARLAPGPPWRRPCRDELL